MVGTTPPTPLYPIYQARFGFSSLIVTVVFAVYALGVIAALLVAGGASDQLGRRSTLGVGLALSAAAAGAFVAAHGLALLFVCRVLSGLSAGIFTGTATAYLGELGGDGAGRSSRATLVATFANMGGLGLGPLLAGSAEPAGAVPASPQLRCRPGPARCGIRSPRAGSRDSGASRWGFTAAPGSGGAGSGSAG